MSKPKLKLGIQCQERVEEVYRYNLQLQPIVVKSINILDPGHYARLAADNPGVDLVYRQVPNGSWRNEGDGRRWAEHLYRLVGHIPEITHVEGHNEWVHSPPHNTPEDYEKADRFMVEFIDRVHELWDGRVHAVVLNASCGHFNEDIVDFFPRTLDKLQGCDKCLLGLHEYDHPDADMLGDGGHNLCGKFLRNLAGLKAAGYDKVRLAITEFGVDSGVGGSGHVGFKYWGTMAWARYLNDRNLSWYLPLVQETEGVAWATIFGCGMDGSWASFDIAGTPVIDGIEAIYSNWVPPEPPEPPEPPPEEEMDIKIYDFDNNPFDPNATTRNWAWLHSIFGPDLRVLNIEEKEDVELQPGDIIYKVAWLDCKVGETSVVIHVEGEDGDAQEGKLPVFGWPSAEEHGLSQTLWKLWTKNGVFGPTNVKGDVGPSMGTGAYYDWTKIDPETGELECGPHFVYVWDLPSDAVYGIGMLTWHPDVEGNHLHVNIGYRAEVYSEEPPTPPTPPYGDLLVEVRRIRVATEGILKYLTDEDPPTPPAPEPYEAEYFANRELLGSPVVTLEHDEIDFDWGVGSPAPGVPADDFSVRFSATRHFEAGTWKFHVRVDDGIRLYVDGYPLIQEWFDQAPRTYEAQIDLAQGDHAILVEYYEHGGGAVCEMSYAKA